MTYEVRLHARARKAVKRYARFIAVDRESPLNAERWLERVWRAVDGLERFPARGALAPENASLPYEVRMALVGKCLLLYHIDEASRVVHVVGFRHGARLPRPDDLPGEPPV